MVNKTNPSHPTGEFPADFLWGASTASHQVEGNTHTQWDEWEQKHAATQYSKTKRMLRKLPGWPKLEQQAKDPNNYICGTGVDHYVRYADDFMLLKQLNMNAYRFSIEWARIEPSPGKWDDREIAHYRQYLQQLRSLSIEPFVTLWHFTLPIWFADKGGFAVEANVSDYLAYVDKIITEFGDLITFVMPLNEPSTYVSLSYVAGMWPPQKHSVQTARKVYQNLIEAHREAYKIIKKHDSSIQVGNAMIGFNDITTSRSPLAKLSRNTWHNLSFNWFMDAVSGYSDFIGLNYYMENNFTWYGGVKNPSRPLNDLGWYMDPPGIAHFLEETYARYKLPIYITENGLADADDSHRQWWISETINGMQSALAHGVDLRGYMHWSLLDNFEWAFGWLAEFGLVHVNRTTMERTIRPSAIWFGSQIAIYRGLADKSHNGLLDVKSAA